MPTVPYSKQTWVDGSSSTPLSAARMGVIENGLNDLSYAPAVRVTHNASQSVTSATPLVLAFNTERFDQAGNASDTMHDTVTNNSRLTAKYAGVYHITANVEFAANATGYRLCSIRLNGTTVIANCIIMCVTTASVPTRVQATCIYSMAVNDYVEVVVDQNSGGALNVTSAANYSPEFMMVRVA